MYIGVTPFDLLTIYCRETANNQEVDKFITIKILNIMSALQV